MLDDETKRQVDNQAQLAAYFALVSRDLLARSDEALTFQRIADRAVEVIPACDFVGITLRRRKGRPVSVALTDEAARLCDDWQYELDEGPCLDALREDHTVRSDDLSTDDRWPTWGPRVVEGLGLLSSVSYRLYLTDQDLGALNLYGKKASAFTEDDIHDGLALAAHVSVALAAAQKVQQLETALGGRTVIGQATGILMERFELGSDRAFSVLSRMSQQRNVKIRVLAEQIVTTRTIPTT